MRNVLRHMVVSLFVVCPLFTTFASAGLAVAVEAVTPATNDAAVTVPAETIPESADAPDMSTGLDLYDGKLPIH